MVRRHRGQPDVGRLPCQLLEGCPPIGVPLIDEGAIPQGEDVERDEDGGRLAGKAKNGRGLAAWAKPGAEGGEIEHSVTHDDHLAVEDDPVGKGSAKRGDDLGECVGEIVATAPLQADAISRSECDRTEAVPLGLVCQRRVTRHGIARERCEHGCDRRLNRQIPWRFGDGHAVMVARAAHA